MIGDIYGTPHTVGGVEWTLRIEVVLYLFMAALKIGGFFDARKNMLVYVLIAATLLINQLPPFPDGVGQWTRGYFALFGPFCLLGVGFFLHEKGEIGIWLLVALGAVVLANYFDLIAHDNPRFLLVRSGEIGVLLFTVAWKFRASFRFNAMVLLTADLTYAVYLFHNWLFDYLKDIYVKLSLSGSSSSLLACVSLLILCYLLNKKIEVPAIRFGRSLEDKFKKNNNSPPAILTRRVETVSGRKE